MNDFALDPIVADLAVTIALDGKLLVLHDEHVKKARTRIKAVAQPDRMRIAEHLVVWAIKLQRIGSEQTVGPRALVVELVLELLGDEKAARDLFGSAGLDKDVSAVIGGATPVRAPRAEPSKPASQPVKPARGLRRT